MDEATGATRVDAVNSYNASDVGAIDVVLDASGKNSGAADWSGDANQVLTVSDTADLKFDVGDISVSLWVSFDTSGESHIFTKFSTGTSSFREIVLRQTSSSTIELIWYKSGGTSDVRFTHTQTLSTGTWYNVAVGRDDSAGEIFIAIDGDKETLGTSTSANSGSADINIGKLGGSTNGPHNGQIDEIAVWHKYLTQTDLNTLYNSGTGTFYASFD
jgi:hypothetical protein